MNGVCDKYCKDCVYNNLAVGEDIVLCTYYFKTNTRRPCPAGTGCTVKKTGKKSGAWTDARKRDWAKKMAEARQAKKVVRTLICAECGKEFEASDPRAKYCSVNCKNRVSQRNMHRRKKPEKQAKSAVGEV